jgi:hypothetical protein
MSYPTTNHADPETGKYPTPCTNCGFCCLASVCALGLKAMGIHEEDKHQSCPALEWDNGKSVCGLAKEPGKYAPPGTTMYILQNPDKFAGLMGFGRGCCVAARVMDMRTGELVEFYTLPEKSRAIMARMVRDNRERLIQTQPTSTNG